MTDFEPSPTEMLFRISVSIFGLLWLVVALSVRGLPADPTHLAFGFASLVFLASSAGLSGLKFRSMTSA